ncbi:PAS domain S-box protein [Argonema antarcticum]|uniref:PAS domain S-box protein n=1 Tax=Argonema antarcticum TaxID=2942763 RepID=UPI002011B589|nr:PAS domain S-box protein [Argonema antarcticum]MCL1475486.1 PAS domain S-box protein [Argonema antarcticum A004/B2]
MDGLPEPVKATLLDEIFPDGGEMGQLMRSLDWSVTPLGPAESWPQSLRTSASICLASPFPILICWGSEAIAIYNDAYRSIFGATKHPQALGQPGRSAWPQIWETIGPMLEGVLNDGRAIQSEDIMLLLERNGYMEECYFTFSYSPIRDETGGIGGVFTAVTETTRQVLLERDISDRKRAEKGLYCREQEFKAMVENSPDMIARFDKELRHIYVNPAIERATGIPAPKFIGKTNSELEIPQEICSYWEENIRYVFETGSERVMEYEFPNQGEIQYYQSRLVPEFAKDGSIEYAICITRDITQLKQTEEALRETNQTLECLIQASPLAIIALDIQGKLKIWSPAAERLFGWSEQEVIDDFPPFIPEEKWQEFLALHQIKLQGKLLAGMEVRRQKKSGEEIDIAVWGAALHDAKGNISGTMAAIADISERQAALRDRKQAQAEREQLIKLLESEQALLEAVLQQMPAAAIVAEAPSGKLLLGNKLVEKIWRQPFLEADTIEQYRIYRGFHLDGQPYEAEEWPLARSIRNGEVVTEEEINFQRGDGSYGTMRVSSTPIYNYEGAIVAGVMTFYDITSSKRAKEELRASEEKFRTLVNSMQDIVFTLDREQRFTGVFGSWLERTGFQAELFLGKTPQEIYELQSSDLRLLQSEISNLKLQAAIHEAHHKKALSGETVVYEWSFENVNGTEYCQTSLSPLRDANGDIIGVVGVGRDITQLHRAKEVQRFLAEASKVLTATLDYETTLKSVARLAVPYLADYCVIFVLEEDRIRRVAVAHRDAAKEALLKELQAYPLDLNSEAPVAQVLRKRQPLLVREVSDSMLVAISREVNEDSILRELDPKSLVVVPLVARGRMLGAIGFTLAESGRRYVPADLVLAEDLAYRAALAFDNARLYSKAQEANRIKDEFLAIVSHELRTPLNAILGWATLLRTRKFDEARTALALETIERNARMQSQLIEDLLDVSRMLRDKLSLDLRPLDLVTVIEAATEALRPTAQNKNIELKLILGDRDCFVSADFNRLQQVLWNLLSNAIKFTPSRGQVEIRLEKLQISDLGLQIEEGKIQSEILNLKSEISSAQITVSDTGKGISPNFLPYVFDRFRQADSTTTREQGGLGLGLAIVRHLVDLHGGTVSVASDGEGKGSTFTVKLPVLNSPEFPAIKLESGSSRSSSIATSVALLDVRILVVDDEADTRDFLTTALEQYGAKVMAADSTESALEALQEWKADVLVSDIGMPGEDGYALIRKVRALEWEGGLELPAVALTAYAMETDRIEALNAGFQRHLSKPIDPIELVSAIEQLLKSDILS